VLEGGKYASDFGHWRNSVGSEFRVARFLSVTLPVVLLAVIGVAVAFIVLTVANDLR
jgi:hypothetical protein